MSEEVWQECRHGMRGDCCYRCEIESLTAQLAAALAERDAAIKRASDLTIECGRHDALVEGLKALMAKLPKMAKASRCSNQFVAAKDCDAIAEQLEALLPTPTTEPTDG